MRIRSRSQAVTKAASVVVASIGFENQLVRNDIFQAPVSLSNPDLINLPWTANGMVVDREILSRDCRGNPKVVLVTGLTMEATNSISISASDPGRVVNYGPHLMPQASVSVTIGTKVYTGSLGAIKLETLAGNFRTKTHSFAELKAQDGEAIMGAHFYTTSTKNGWELRVRIHNGVLNPHCGAVFYDKLVVIVNREEHVLASPMANGKHLFRPQEQILVSYESGKQIIQGKVTRANSYFSSGGFGAEDERLPYFMNQYGGAGDASAEAKVKSQLSRMSHALETGVADPSVDLQVNRMGPFMPLFMGDTGPSAPGGWGISTVAIRTQSQAETELLKLQQECTLARTPRAIFNKQGQPQNVYSFIGPDGKIPFYFNTIGGWLSDKAYLQQQNTLPHFRPDQGKAYNTGTCPYLGSKWSGGMAGFEGYDDAHYSRGVRYVKSLYYLTGDWAARDDLIAMAEWAHFSWIEMDTTDSYWHDHGHSVFNQLRWHVGSEHKWGSLERSFGWTCDSMAQAYAVAPDAWRVKFKPWFVAAEKLIDVSTMPTGLTQREPVGSHLHQTAITATPAFPVAGFDVAGAIYIGICCQGFQAINRAVFGNQSAVIRTYLSKVIDFCFSQPLYGASGPCYYMSPGASGNPEAFTAVSQSVFAGGLEGYNFWWSCIHAYRATGDRKYFEMLRKYGFERPTHLAKSQQLFTNANGWDDKLSEAAYYIAEVEWKLQTEGPV